MLRPLVLACAAVLSVAGPGPAADPPLEPLARLGTTRFRHTAPVRSVAFRPDGKAVAAAAEGEPFVRVWDAGTGHELRRYADPAWPPTKRIDVVGYTADGRRLVTVYDEQTVAAFDTESGKVVTRFLVADGSPGAVALSPVGSLLVARQMDGKPAVWELDTGRLVGTVAGIPDDGGFRLCFSPDGRQVAVGCPTRVLIAPVDASQPAREVVRFSPHDVPARLLWPRPDRLVLAAIDRLVSVDPATGKEVARAAGYAGHIAVVVPSGRLVVMRFKRLELVEVDPGTLEPIPGRVVPTVGPVSQVAAKADGSGLVIAAGCGVRLVTATGSPIHPDLDRFLYSPAGSFRFSADGRRMLAVPFWGGAVVWGVDDGVPAASLPACPSDQLLSPDGRWVAGLDDQLTIWDASSGAEVFREPPAPAGTSRRTGVAGFDPSGGLWTWERDSGTVTRVEGPSGRVTRTFPGFRLTGGATLSPDGRRLAVMADEVFAVRDTDPSADWHIERYDGRGEPGMMGWHPDYPLAFTPDGARLFARNNNRLTVWNVTGRPALLAQRPAPDGWGHRVTFSPDGRRLMFQRFEQMKLLELCVWETATLAEVFRFAPPGGLTGFGLTPDGRQLIVGHPDTTLTVWDARAVEGRGLGTRFPDALPNDLWEFLGSRDPKVGLAAARALADDPATAVALLRERFRPVDPARVAALVANLGDPSFAVREKAFGELAALGPAAEAGLRDAARSPSPEVGFRARQLLAGFEVADGRLAAAHLRAVRAVEVLERIATPEARTLLAEWAPGHAGTVLGAEARAAAARLAAGR